MTMRKIGRVVIAIAAFVVGERAAAQSLTTTFAHNNAFAGNMFNVNVLGSGLTFTGMDVNIGVFLGATGAGAGGTAAQVALWTRTGSYVGFENAAAGWTLRGIVSTAIAGTNLASFVNFGDFTLGSGVHGFYVDYTNYNAGSNPLRELLYTNGSNTYANADLSISTGIGKGIGFGGENFQARSWNGTLYYDRPTTVVPEPSTVALLAGGLAAMMVVARRRRA